jgi:hypothetical protein
MPGTPASDELVSAECAHFCYEAHEQTRRTFVQHLIASIASSHALELQAAASALCLARLQPGIQAVFLPTTDRWHNRNFCPGRNSRGKSTRVTHILVGHKNIHVPSSFARFG